MSVASAANLLVLFLLSLASRATIAKMFCLVSSLLSLLLSVEPYGAVMPWVTGMIIAVVTVVETQSGHFAFLSRRSISISTP